MATSRPPRPNSVDWGSLLYLKLWRRLIAAGIPPFRVLPFCFSDAISCRLDNRLPDPFQKDSKIGHWPLKGPPVASSGHQDSMAAGGALDQTLQKIFGIHLHNQWDKAFPLEGWVERLLLNRYNSILGVTNDP